VAFPGERTHERLAFGLGHVHRDRFLSPVGGGEIRGVLGVFPFSVLDPWRPEGARVVADLRTLHLDHFGAEIGEVLSRPGAGKAAGKVENADVRKGSGHVESLRDYQRLTIRRTAMA